MQEVEFDDKEVAQFLRQVAKNMKNPGKIDAVVGAFSAIVFADVMDHFRTEKGPNEKWQAWSKMYAEHMKKIGRGNNKKLQFSGRLRGTFKPESRRVTPTSFNWFNNAKTKSGYPYAWGHDSGDGKQPQREFMWLSDKAFGKMEDVIWQLILEEAENG